MCGGASPTRKMILSVRLSLPQETLLTASSSAWLTLSGVSPPPPALSASRSVWIASRSRLRSDTLVMYSSPLSLVGDEADAQARAWAGRRRPDCRWPRSSSWPRRAARPCCRSCRGRRPPRPPAPRSRAPGSAALPPVASRGRMPIGRPRRADGGRRAGRGVSRLVAAASPSPAASAPFSPSPRRRLRLRHRLLRLARGDDGDERPDRRRGAATRQIGIASIHRRAAEMGRFVGGSGTTGGDRRRVGRQGWPTRAASSGRPATARRGSPGRPAASRGRPRRARRRRAGGTGTTNRLPRVGVDGDGSPRASGPG